MTGFLLLGVASIWLAVALSLTWWAVKKINKGIAVRVLASIGLFALLLPLPLADEILGGFQFRALCAANTTPQYDEAKARGKTVYMRSVPHPEVANVMVTPSRKISSFLPINEKTIDWVDESTGNVVISYKTYEVKGGWLIRSLRISNSDSPLSFDPSFCRPSSVELFEKLNITSK